MYPGMFAAALLTICKNLKQLKCLSTEEWIQKLVYLYNLYTILILENHKNEQITETDNNWINLKFKIRQNNYTGMLFSSDLKSQGSEEEFRRALGGDRRGLLRSCFIFWPHWWLHGCLLSGISLSCTLVLFAFLNMC